MKTVSSFFLIKVRRRTSYLFQTLQPFPNRAISGVYCIRLVGSIDYLIIKIPLILYEMMIFGTPHLYCHPHANILTVKHYRHLHTPYSGY